MLNWSDYRKQLGAALGGLNQVHPELMKGFHALDAGAAQTATLDAKTRELIALAVAVTTRCDGCIAFHTEAAVKAGATRQEIAEALGVAIALNAGPALIYSARVMDAFAQQTGG
ncbi:MAG: carboxymuconolactone decarboxylase family protein [Gammaproteobacteria bacterium]|nr:carboxymuconolactone decarboxylase family protein [Gammaproteobacteria bacterium]